MSHVITCYVSQYRQMSRRPHTLGTDWGIVLQQPAEGHFSDGHQSDRKNRSHAQPELEHGPPSLQLGADVPRAVHVAVEAIFGVVVLGASDDQVDTTAESNANSISMTAVWWLWP